MLPTDGKKLKDARHGVGVLRVFPTSLRWCSCEMDGIEMHGENSDMHLSFLLRGSKVLSTSVGFDPLGTQEMEHLDRDRALGVWERSLFLFFEFVNDTGIEKSVL